ncbi:NUDIX domain-containing protein [Methylocystis bryophila]|uniref:DNA mismatch repair protein MutT n=1 Tax=Methylocystis bryophila TaxID=655015 RepID=A0A1W6MZ73_9HYPH|nr:NUDIX domain-containing protein [Methylocystis bryophila]ARN82853.1 DNA mismatch repair protein MutT [Methylocystis bryophila]BDV39113.1 NUDIX hydrolase [Methylocystis bryophila]
MPKPPRPRAHLSTQILTRLALVTRPMTLGVRALVVDDQTRVLLVRHTYVPGYFLPGGGVEGGETMEAAMRRELVEETNVEAEGPLTLHGIYLNRAASKRDHVALYVTRDFRQIGPHVPDREIAEAGFFSIDALPATTTLGTRARIAEVLTGAAMSAYW